jgi:hypothetical protein
MNPLGLYADVLSLSSATSGGPKPTLFGRAVEVATGPSRLLQMEKEMAGLRITCPFFNLFSHFGHRSHHSLINRGFGRRIDRLCCIVVITSSVPQSHHDSTGHCDKLWVSKCLHICVTCHR